MAEDKVPLSSKKFDERLRAAQDRRRHGERGSPRSSGYSGSALGFAFRIGIELVSALVVGVGIGWLLDYWLGTQPWLLLLFFVLGAAAGIMNVYRAVERMGKAGDGDAKDDGKGPGGN